MSAGCAIRKDSGLIPGTATSFHCDPWANYLTSGPVLSFVGWVYKYLPPRRIVRIKQDGVMVFVKLWYSLRK